MKFMTMRMAIIFHMYAVHQLYYFAFIPDKITVLTNWKAYDVDFVKDIYSVAILREIKMNMVITQEMFTEIGSKKGYTRGLSCKQVPSKWGVGPYEILRGF